MTFPQWRMSNVFLVNFALCNAVLSVQCPMFLCWCILMHFSPLAQGAALVLAATVLVGGLGHEEGDGRLVNVMRMRRTVTMVMVVGGVLLQQLLQQNLAHERNLRIDGEPPSGSSKKLKSAT